MRTRRSFRLGVLGALLLSCAAVFAPAASAHPANVEVFCESGASRYYCQVSFTGAHDPTTIHWYRNGSYIPAFDNLSFVTQSCVVGQWYTLVAVVTDAHGPAQNSYSFECRRVWQ